MPKKVKLFAAGVFLALVGVACVALVTASAKAEDEGEWEPGDPYPPIAGKGWSIDADGVLRVKNDAAWQDYLANGPGDWIWEYSDSGIMDERVQKLVIGKDVTTLSIYDPIRWNMDAMAEDVAQQLSYNAGIYKPYVSVAMQDPKCMPPKIEVEAGNRVFSVVDGLLINNVKKSVVLSEFDVSDVVIPDGIQSIEAWAFYYRNVKSVSFPNSLKVIGAAAFSNCNLLTSVTLPNSLIKLETCAFSSCSSLWDVKLSSNLKTIEGMAFSSCPIEEITIPNGIEKIDFWVFSGCNALKKVHLPNTVKRIESYAFSDCKQLEEINLPDSLTYIGYHAFEYCTSWLVIILPNSLNRIGEESFWGCEPILLQLPQTLSVEIVPPEERGWSTNLDEEESTQLLGIDYVETLVVTGNNYSLGPYAVKVADQLVFLGKPSADWHSFAETVYSKNVYYLDQYAQSWNSIDKIAWSGVTLEQWTKEQVQKLFQSSEALAKEGHVPSAPDVPKPIEVRESDGWSITSNGILTLKSNDGWVDWLRQDDLASVNILIITKDVTDLSFRDDSGPDSPKSTGNTTDSPGSQGQDFPGQSTRSSYLHPSKIYVDQGNPVYYYGGGMLVNLKTMEIVLSDETMMKDIVLPEGIRSIGNGAYKGRSIQSIQLPSTFERIGADAFSDCRELSSIAIPDSVTQIGENAFRACSSLQAIRLSENLKTIADGTFSNCDLQELVLPDGITEIGDEAFFGCSKLRQVVLPAHLKSLGQSAFEYCQSLSYVWFPDQLERIGTLAFGNCTTLANVILPDSLYEIGELAFQYCKLSMLRVPPKLLIDETDLKTNESKYDPTDKNNETFGLKSVDCLYFSGSDYDFGESSFQHANSVYFQELPPKGIGDILSSKTVKNIFCTNSNRNAWRSEDVASWVRDRLQTMPDGEMNAIVENELKATPRPIATAVLTQNPNATQSSNATKTPENVEDSATRETIDPVILAMAVIIVLVIAAVAILAIQSGTKYKKRRKKHTVEPQPDSGTTEQKLIGNTSDQTDTETNETDSEERK